MKTDKPQYDSGKTYYNRIKKKGESWTALRDAANKHLTSHEKGPQDPLGLADGADSKQTSI